MAHIQVAEQYVICLFDAGPRRKINVGLNIFDNPRIEIK